MRDEVRGLLPRQGEGPRLVLAGMKARLLCPIPCPGICSPEPHALRCSPPAALMHAPAPGGAACALSSIFDLR